MLKLLAGLVALIIPVLVVYAASAQEAEPTSTTQPTPASTPTATPAPTRTPRPNEGTLVVFVINDLNRNGIRDPGEPGVEGWTLTLGCGDLIYDEDVTDADGNVVFLVKRGQACVYAREPFGWVLTSDRFVRAYVRAGRVVEASALAYKAGEQLQRYAGSLIINGFPAPEGTMVDALVDGRSCGDVLVSLGDARTRFSLYVLGERDRAGCAREGQPVALAVNGVVVRTDIFEVDTTRFGDLNVGPAPMYFDLAAPEGTTPVPYVEAIGCGEAIRKTGPLLLPNSYTVYVLPAGLRAGCGAPGRIVTVMAGGEIIRQVLWREGFVWGEDLQDVALGDTGGGAPRSGVPPASRLWIALALAGAAFLALGIAVRRFAKV